MRHGRCGSSSPVGTRQRPYATRCRAPGRFRCRPRARAGGAARCGCSTTPQPRSFRATSRGPRAPDSAGAELFQGLGEDRVAVLVVAPLAHIGEVGLVRLVAWRRGGRLTVAAGGEPAAWAVPAVRDRCFRSEGRTRLMQVGAPEGNAPTR